MQTRGDWVGWGSLLSAVLVGCLNREVTTPDAVKGIQPVVARRTPDQPSTLNVDLLFVVDDSISMADKQRILRSSLSSASGYAVRCAALDGGQALPVHGVCPTGYNATLLLGMMGSVGMITTSMEGGGTGCKGTNRSAHLFPALPDDEVLQKYGSQIVGQLDSVGESGCGYEAPLEAMYRFLVDPEPPLEVNAQETSAGFTTVTQGIDQELLQERTAFLHPFAQVVVVVLTDEDDCSVRDYGGAWQIGAPPGLPRGTSVCQTDPGNSCCRSCNVNEAEPPSGCTSVGEDATCAAGPWSSADDDPNLRCWDERQRFGQDWLFAVERYTDSLTSSTVVTRSGATVPNPLLADGRSADAISVLIIAGTPWQFITTPESITNQGVMDFMDSNDLAANGVWKKILGDPTQFVPPSDPHMVEAADPRPGLPLPGAPLDPINGHEIMSSTTDELQLSCIFPLPEPRDCSGDDSCECSSAPGVESPLCLQPDNSYGTLQRFAGARPPLRLLEFANSLGSRGHLASICPRQLDDPEKAGFGYSDGLLDFVTAFQSAWDLSCFYPPLPVDKDGNIRCKLLEYHDSVVDCTALGRKTASGKFVEAFLNQLRIADDATSTTICEIPPMPGDPREPSSPSYACSHDQTPSPTPSGYCYIDPDLNLGDESLVDACVSGNRRRVRAVPRTLPVPDTLTNLICDYGE
jgi:hypothetical protein